MEWNSIERLGRTGYGMKQFCIERLGPTGYDERELTKILIPVPVSEVMNASC